MVSVGQEWDGSNGSDFFDGTIDNLTIYNYEMSSSEVSSNASALTNGTYVPSSTVTPIAVNTYKTINASATYTSDGNYITSVTDSRGNSAYYDYNTTYGRLNSFRAPGETTVEATSYTYDANTDLVSSVSKTVDGKTYTNSYTYDLDKLSTITHNGFDYEFSYDSFNNPYQVKVAGVTLITNSYQANNGPLDTSTYGNGDLVKYEYDEYHRVITKKLDNITKFEYTYDNQGNLSRMIDHSGVTEVSYTYIYDFMNRLTKVVGSNNHHMLFTYDEFGRINMMSNTINETSNQNEYVYGDKNVVEEIPGLIYNVKLNGTTQLSYEFDQLARLSTRTLGTTSPFTTIYTYLDGAGTNSTTTLLGSMQNGSNEAFNYTYDSRGNILTISEGTLPKATYTYDKMNQLISEDNVYTSKSIDYVYDIGGNIVSRTEYNYINGSRGPLIDTYNYGYSTSWKDQLITYDGQSITYDEIGNPLTYRDNLSFTWANGRELSTINNNGISGSYTYNDSGIRTSKTYDGVTTNYYLNGSSIVRQVTGSKILDFFYDENGNLYGFKDDGDMYYYVRNGQSDIIGILDNNGIQVVYYQYDSWGNPLTPSGSLASTIGADNPFRYRGYYLDSETGLYYLNSRYYDSNVGRFINADDTNILDGGNYHMLENNLFAYCFNNPVNMTDEDGQWPSWVTKVLIGTAVITALAIVTVCTAGTGTVLAAVAVGALQGAAAGAVVGAASGAAFGAISHRVTTGSWKGVGGAALNGAATGYMMGAVMGAVAGGINGYSNYYNPPTTVHGEQQLTARGFSKADIKSIKGTNVIRTQTDGAYVYIKSLGNGKYSYIVQGKNGVITGLKNISKGSLDKLAKNYGWR